MGKWDSYKVSQSSAPSTNKWDEFRVTKNTGDSWPALIGKSALKGLSSIADIPRLAAEGAEGIYNMGAKMRGAPVGAYGMGLRPVSKSTRPNIAIDENAPQTNYAANIPTSFDARKKINEYTGYNLEPNPASPAQRIAANAAEFGGSLVGFGGLGAASKGANIFDKFRKTANLAKTGAGIGAASGVAQEAGVNPLVADLGASMAAPSNALKKTYNAVRHPLQSYAGLERNLMGLTPDKLKLDVAQAARNSNIDLPAAVLTDAKFTALADQLVSKTPYLGDKLKKKYEHVNEQVKNRLEEIYDTVGPRRSAEVEDNISKYYDVAKNTLPKDAQVYPKPILDNIRKIEEIQANTLSPNKYEQELFTEAAKIKKGLVPEGFENLKIPAEVRQLIGTKKSLNGNIDWDKDAGVKNLLKGLQGSFVETIGNYGKINPTWHKNYDKAEKYFGKVAKRQDLENFLSEKGINYANDSVNHAALSKVIHHPKNAKKFQNLVDNETFAKIGDIATVSRGMAQKGVNNPNPSGTAPVTAIGSFLVSLWADPTNIVTPMTTLLGTARATKLLTDKKFIDNAVKFAENPNNLAVSTSLNERMKKLTGYSAVSLNKELSKQINERQ